MADNAKMIPPYFMSKFKIEVFIRKVKKFQSLYFTYFCDFIFFTWATVSAVRFDLFDYQQLVVWVSMCMNYSEEFAKFQ